MPELGVFPNNPERYRGVTFSEKRRNWRAQIGYKGKVVYLGTYLSPEKAARAYDQAAKLLFGTVAILNFPETDHGP
jgi:hypothetical protein